MWGGVELDPTSKIRVLEEYIHRGPTECQKLAMRDWGTEGSGQRGKPAQGPRSGARPGKGWEAGLDRWVGPGLRGHCVSYRLFPLNFKK